MSISYDLNTKLLQTTTAAPGTQAAGTQAASTEATQPAGTTASPQQTGSEATQPAGTTAAPQQQTSTGATQPAQTTQAATQAAGTQAATQPAQTSTAAAATQSAEAGQTQTTQAAAQEDTQTSGESSYENERKSKDCVEKYTPGNGGGNNRCKTKFLSWGRTNHARNRAMKKLRERMLPANEPRIKNGIKYVGDLKISILVEEDGTLFEVEVDADGTTSVSEGAQL